MNKWTPKRKVGASLIGGAAATIVIGILTRAGITLSPDEVGSIVTLCGVGLAYLVPEPA